MTMKRVMRFVGNREKPEKELYGTEEILRNTPLASIATDLNKMFELAVTVNGLNEIKKLSFDELCKAQQLVDEVRIPSIWELPGFNSLFTPVPLPNMVRWAVPPGNPRIFPEEQKLEDPDYEVNLVEPLVGWRRWDISIEAKRITSQSGHGGAVECWPVDEPLVAKCKLLGMSKHRSPNETCPCGIYAGDSRQAVEGYDGPLGLVYGWGRYIRGSSGWRSEFAYPKCFYLRSPHPDVVEILKQYHVPIFIDQPVLMYSPEEDGYEHRSDEADGCLRAYRESLASEEEDDDY